MALTDIVIDREYRSFSKDIVRSFFIPVLNHSVEYYRAVGFFSSTALIEVSQGLISLLNNGGKINLICSPKLTEDDIEAINRGYSERKKIIEAVALRGLAEPRNHFEEERLNLLAHLIENGQLDIKLALVVKDGSYAIYHEKMGIFKDRENNVVVFSGSLNESITAYYSNYETIDVFCSWKSEFEQGKIQDKILAFNRLWQNEESGIEILQFPEVCKEKLLSYKQSKVNLFVDEEEFSIGFKDVCAKEPSSKLVYDDFPQISETINLHDYQKQAIAKWFEQEHVGIFDMATGTGKTFTGLAAICELFNKVSSQGLAVVIVCPFIHLVNQWVNEMALFGITHPIIGYSGSPDRQFKSRLKEAVIDFNVKIKGFFCFVSTNATFATEAVQGEMRKLRGNVLLVVDEAHNLGAEKLQKTLGNHFKYRLALSATLERHRDEIGTQRLREFFGEKCIIFTLEEAIEQKKLSNYYYHPIVVNLNAEELSRYNEISQKLKKMISVDDRGQQKLTEQAKLLLIKRARIVAGAANKLPALIECMRQHSYCSHMLVYCGAANVIDDDYFEDEEDDRQNDERQIDAAIKELDGKLDMKVARFTSRENLVERKLILEAFTEGDNIQVLVAIKCLDEGVNIPKIDKAFILASSTNPKEFIQRRGRVLRLAKGKKYAEIFDFVTLPRPLDSVSSLTEEAISNDFSLIFNEIKRVEEFKSLSLNPQAGDKLIADLKDAYHLHGRKEYI